MRRPGLLSLLVSPRRRAVPVVAGLALLAAVVPAGRASAASGDCVTSGGQVTCTFTYTGGAQTWMVPPGVSQAAFTLYGAEGGSSIASGAAGLGAEVTATLPVAAGTVLQVNAGQAGAENSGVTFGGGGAASGDAAAGGGATDVRSPAADGSYPLANRLLVAGGGGGGGSVFGPVGSVGGAADSAGGSGGSAADFGATLAGGAGGGAGTTTGPGAGGAAGPVTGTSTCPNSQIFPGTAGGGGGTGPSQGTGGSGSSHSGGGAGGGGGGGYYGGGGGGGGAADPGSGCDAFAGGGGGGGGASYTGAVSGAVVTDGVAAPDDAPAGEVIISYQVATPDATRLSAGSVLFRISPGQVVLTLRLSATLTDTVTGQRVAGQLITFTVGGRTVCTAVTGSRGWAVCRGRDAVLQALLAGHYTASFAGTPMLQPATAQGYLIKI